jgi:hypothetical protein
MLNKKFIFFLIKNLMKYLLLKNLMKSGEIFLSYNFKKIDEIFVDYTLLKKSVKYLLIIHS